MPPDELYDNTDRRHGDRREDHEDRSDDPDLEKNDKHEKDDTSDKSSGKDKSDKSDKSDEKKTDDGKPKKNIFQNRTFQIVAIIVVAILVVVGIIWWLIARQYQDTDDAFIDTHIVLISPQVAGQVTQLYVTDNQLVHAGDPLVEIDAADARARMEQVQAQEIQAETQYHQALATADGAEAQLDNASRDLARYRTLQHITPAAVAQQQIDQAVAVERNATAQRDATRAQIAGALAQINVFKAQIGAAQLTLGYTHIVAPVAGHIAQRTVAVGNYVSPGQEVMAIVPLDLWVTANFKETQLTRMRVGQKVTIILDACGGRKASGHVDSVQRGAGQAFGILPPENATGNFVKVVQRVPVKITFDNIPDGCVVGPGMSVEPSVKVR